MQHLRLYGWAWGGIDGKGDMVACFTRLRARASGLGAGLMVLDVRLM